MQATRIIFNRKTPPIFALWLMLCCFSTKVFCQERVDTPITNFVPQPPPDKKPKPAAPISGRVLGVNLENVSGVTVTNVRSDEKTLTNSIGIFQLTAAKGDTLTFEVGKYSKRVLVVGSVKDKLNVVLFKRKTDRLPPAGAGYNKANREDEELLRILEKDAKLEGKWNY